jgi:hypothetical protein
MNLRLLEGHEMLSTALVEPMMMAMYKYRLINDDWPLCRATLDALIRGLYDEEINPPAP